MMLGAYGKIFQAPGAKSFAAAGFVARLPIAMAPIGIVAMISQTSGSYFVAGAVSATFALANALVAPQISRVVDRLGQARIVGPAAAISSIAFLGLVVAARWDWPTWSLFVAALLAAAMPSIPAMMRARWSALFKDRPELATAFAFESAADELVYIAGASIAVALSVSLFPEAGMLAAALMLAVGTAALLVQRSTEPPIVEEHGPRAASAILLRPVQFVTLALIFVGVIFATAEVGVVALTEALGRPGAASPVIGVYALGSFVVGIAMGALQPKTALHRQLTIAIAVIAATQVPLLFADSVTLLAAAVFVSGLAISPTFITAFGTVAQRVPPHMLTEGVTWVFTGIGIGMAFGAFLAGWVIESFGPRAGFSISVLAGLSALATIAIGRRSLAGEAAGALRSPVGETLSRPTTPAR